MALLLHKSDGTVKAKCGRCGKLAAARDGVAVCCAGRDRRELPRVAFLSTIAEAHRLVASGRMA